MKPLRATCSTSPESSPHTSVAETAFPELKTFSTSEARMEMARILTDAQQQPVIIRYHRRDAVVMLSVREYQRLTALAAMQDNRLN